MIPSDYESCPHCTGFLNFAKPDKTGLCPFCSKNVLKATKRRSPSGQPEFDLLSAFRIYTAKKKMPYLMMTFMDDGSGQILDGENIIADFNDITELSKILGI